ncbi:hypothetical protein QJQ45_012223 [Haematococcus lacustris]|nr:hypothetical protein QJQ45_012223 [Haematococcus lacustris]
MCSTNNGIRFYDRDVSAALNIARIAAGPGRPRELSSWKKKAKKPKKVDDVAEGQDAQVEEASASVVDPSAPKPVDPAAVNVMSGKKYEEEFEVKQMVPAIEAAAGGLLGAAWLQFEKLRRETGKARSTPWGSTYRQAPEILHGYTKKVLGVTAEERLDIRASTKADKFCVSDYHT